MTLREHNFPEDTDPIPLQSQQGLFSRPLVTEKQPPSGHLRIPFWYPEFGLSIPNKTFQIEIEDREAISYLEIL